MNTAAKVTIGIGIVVIIVGIIVIYTGLSDAGRTAEDGVVHETGSRALSSMALNGESDRDPHLYVHINSTYVGGETGGYNERHGNNTWNLTAEDCDKVRNFTFRNYTDHETLGNLFFPRCNYVEDITGDDEWIVVGTICKEWQGNRVVGPGCPDALYTWLIPYNGLYRDTNVMVYDGDMLGIALLEGLFAIIGSIGACCCGSVILIIGIIMAATMEDNGANPYNQQTTSNSETIPPASSGWDNQEDYIHRENKEEEIPESEEGNKSGEYKIPPPE